MQAVKFECEEALVAEAIGLAEDRLDFVVDAFHAPIADAVFPPSEDAAGVARERFDKRLEPVGVADIGRGKGGAASKRLPQAAHSHLGTSATRNTGLRPMGTVCSSRNRRPLRTMSLPPHAGHRIQSGFTERTNRMQPS